MENQKDNTGEPSDAEVRLGVDLRPAVQSGFAEASVEIDSVPDLYRLAFMPGCFRCPKCGFILTKVCITPNLEILGTREQDRESEPCPNDGTMLVHVTYREQLEVYAERLREEIQRGNRLEEALAKYRWRPIAEIHEDLGPCVLMRLDDPGYMEIGSNLDEDFNEAGFTHFAEVPKLTNEEAEALREALGG